MKHSEISEFVFLAADTGTALLWDGLYREATYHFQLALEKILDSQSLLCRNDDLKNGVNGEGNHDTINVLNDMPMQPGEVEGAATQCIQNCTMEHAPLFTIKPDVLGEPISFRVMKSKQHDWLSGVSIALLYNSAVAQFKERNYETSKRLLEYTLELLGPNIIQNSRDEGASSLSLFHNKLCNVSFVLSMHYLLAHAILQTSRSNFTGSTKAVSIDAVLEAKKHCFTAMEYAQNNLKLDDVQNNLHLAPILSLLGYCRIFEKKRFPQNNDDGPFSDISESIFYGAAVELYDGYRPAMSDMMESINSGHGSERKWPAPSA